MGLYTGKNKGIREDGVNLVVAAKCMPYAIKVGRLAVEVATRAAGPESAKIYAQTADGFSKHLEVCVKTIQNILK